jgi:hypothetical protein
MSQSYTLLASERQNRFLKAPTPDILYECVQHLMRGHRLLRLNLPRSEHPTLRQRRLSTALDEIRGLAERIELEARS